MKQKHCNIIITILLALSSSGSIAQTIFFSDNFSNGSTTNNTSIRTGSPTASATSYDIASTKNTVFGGAATNGTSIAPNDLRLALTSGTTAAFLEAQANFTTNGSPIALTATGDYIDIKVVFTNTINTVFQGGPLSSIWLGLFDSGGTTPVPAGGLAQSGLGSGATFTTGNCANWRGYVSQIYSNTAPTIITRPLQNGASPTTADQELLGNNAGTGAFTNPKGTTLVSSTATPIALTLGGTYTDELIITLTGTGTYSISNFLYSGAGTGGTILLANGTNTVTGANYLTTTFDGLGIGIFSKGNNANPVIDISSIVISGQSTAVTGPPLITAQPIPVWVATNGACQFTTAATGVGVTYQWYRNNTALSDGGHISGSTSPILTVSPSQIADAFNMANGYYVKVSGVGGYSTNSFTNALTLVNATNLFWSDTGNHIWDLNTNANWLDANNNPNTFTYGDPVVFDDSSSLKTVSLAGSYLSASTLTVNSLSGKTYTFSGSGSFAGPGTLIYTGTGQLTLNNANTYTGGTLVSNELSPGSLYLYLENYNGLGNGPVVFDNNNGTMEIVPTGSATLGVNGTVNVVDDFNIIVDGAGTFAAVFLGDLAGTSGKTLTINPKNGGTTNRFRAYGINTTYNANLILDNVDGVTSQAIYYGTVLAPYGVSGSQTYNGIIHGVGGIVQRGNCVTYLNNNQNDYSGGTVPTAGAIGFGADSIPTTGAVTSGPIGTGSLLIAPEVGSASGSGMVFAAGGARTIGNTLQYPSGTNNQTLIIGGTNNLTFTAPFALNGIDGITLSSITSRFIQVTNTAATIFAGVISDSTSTYALTKTGVGPLYLNAANTYTGSTTNNSSASTNAPGLLAGNGSIAGNVYVLTNSAIGGGSADAIGTLSIGGNLTLSGNGWFRVNRNGGSPLYDQVSVSGILTNTSTGKITITNLGAALRIGDTFQIFNKAMSNGLALTVTGGGASWTNKLAVDGTIQVIPGVNTNLTNITFSVSGNTLSLSWPADHTGWRLLVQTNHLSAGVSQNTNDWGTVSGSASINQTNIIINSSLPTEFYRLVYP